MKKLVLFFAAAVAISFASCGSQTTTPEATAPDGDAIENTTEGDSLQAEGAVNVEDAAVVTAE